MRPVTTFPNSSEAIGVYSPNVGSAAVIEVPQQPLTEISPAKVARLSECYRCLLVFDEKSGGQYCLAQAEAGTPHAYQVVLIKKIRFRSIHTLHKPSPRILSVLDFFHTPDSIVLVLERPGILLSRIVLAPSLNEEYISTICREV